VRELQRTVEEDDELGVVLGADLKTANLGQALQGHVAELGDLEELWGRVGELSNGQRAKQESTRVMRWSMTGVSKM
jgi:hypothetical protein